MLYEVITDRQVTYQLDIEAGESYSNGEFQVVRPIGTFDAAQQHRGRLDHFDLHLVTGPGES